MGQAEGLRAPDPACRVLGGACVPLFTAELEIHLKPGALDPQGQAVAAGLRALGHAGVTGVRVGKHLRLGVEATDEAAAGAEVRRMCDELLANPVMETFSYRVRPADAATPRS